MKAVLILLLAAAASAARPRPAPVQELPEDLGPATIDVSSYPPEQQDVYKKIFLPAFEDLRGGPARAINSPLIEIDAAGEDGERRAHPAIAADPALALYTRDGWRKQVVTIKTRPPCCGACPRLTKEEAMKLWSFLAYDSLRRKTGAAAETWAATRRGLIKRFAEIQKEKKS